MNGKLPRGNEHGAEPALISEYCWPTGHKRAPPLSSAEAAVRSPELNAGELRRRGGQHPRLAAVDRLPSRGR
jgi:hypothetical protein